MVKLHWKFCIIFLYFYKYCHVNFEMCERIDSDRKSTLVSVQRPAFVNPVRRQRKMTVAVLDMYREHLESHVPTQS
jgi:hypothetical protein